MKVFYIPDQNMLTIIWKEQEVAETIELEPALFVDVDEKGNVLGIESHDAKGFLEKAKEARGLSLPEVVLEHA
jgi:uncharacterized protein YuzE